MKSDINYTQIRKIIFDKDEEKFKKENLEDNFWLEFIKWSYM